MDNTRTLTFAFMDPPFESARTVTFFRLLDADNDRKLSKEELQNAAKILDKLDRNKNGTIEPEELLPEAPKRERKKEPEPGKEVERKKDVKPRKERKEEAEPGPKSTFLNPRPGTLKVGDAAPDFEIKDADGKKDIKLSALKGKPVVLIFGSCT